ncbi:MAG: ABC transporter substrate-binding protein [Candidatus Omnitrophica bacterium]|nr:ABC transporter substrate-binding protein [Candidatus Omnitrophota bacterium]
MMNRLLALMLCAAMMTAPGCEKATAHKKPPIRISVNIWPGFALAYLAEEKGFFKKNNVEVELILKDSTPESLELFTSGEVDGCFDLFADMIMINSKGIPAKIVCVVDYSVNGDVIIGRPDLGSLADLAGKTVSFEGVNTFSHIFVLSALEKAGLNENDVKFKNVKAHNVLVELENKSIDAGHTWEPTKTEALQKGYKILAKAGDTPGIITDILAFNPRVIAERPDDIRGIVKSMFEALDYLEHNHDESVKIMADKMGMTNEEMLSGLSGIHQPDIKEQTELLTTTTTTTTTTISLYKCGKIITDFLLNRGQMPRSLDINNVIEPKFIEELSGK